MSIELHLIISTKLVFMQKRLKTSGSGWELYFSKPFLQLLGYNPKETMLFDYF